MKIWTNKALDEIYKIYMLLHRSDLNISEKNSAIFNEKNEIREWCKGVHCVDLGESFPTSLSPCPFSQSSFRTDS